MPKTNLPLQTVEKSFPVGSIEAYIYWVNQIPMLSKDEEYQLASSLHNNNDLEAAKKLVLAHLRFVVHVAKKYVNYGLQLADLIQEGNVGLMKAVKRFDYKLGIRLVSFAVHWIKAEINEFVLRNWRIVKMATTKPQRKLFFNIRKMAQKMGRLGWFTSDEVDLVAKELKVKPAEVRAMEARLNNFDVPFDGFTDDEDNPRWDAPEYYLEDPVGDPAISFEQDSSLDTRKQNLSTALLSLDTRSQDIINNRWLKEKKLTLQELAAKYKVSAERIRQLEESALSKLKKQIAN